VALQGRLDEAISLEDLAGIAHFSPYHFHRIFRGMVGESVMEHVRRLRLERAAHRLKFTDQPVTNIAFDAGYETHEAFTRAFRARFDDSPSGYRDKHRTISFPVASSGVYYSADGSVGDFTPLMAWAFPKGLFRPGMMLIGLAHDDPEVTEGGRIRYDACITVPADVQPAGEVGVQEITGGDYAITTHRGPYETLGQTYLRLCGAWLPASGRELRSAPAFEAYLNNPQVTPPEALLTDIYLPLAAN
jgi:AraC family transcriptional regulator